MKSFGTHFVRLQCACGRGKFSQLSLVPGKYHLKAPSLRKWALMKSEEFRYVLRTIQESFVRLPSPYSRQKTSVYKTPEISHRVYKSDTDVCYDSNGICEFGRFWMENYRKLYGFHRILAKMIVFFVAKITVLYYDKRWLDAYPYHAVRKIQLWLLLLKSTRLFWFRRREGRIPHFLLASELPPGGTQHD